MFYNIISVTFFVRECEMVKLTLEINSQIYSIETNDVEKLKAFIDRCIDLEEQIKKAIEELKHF